MKNIIIIVLSILVVFLGVTCYHLNVKLSNTDRDLTVTKEQLKNNAELYQHDRVNLRDMIDEELQYIRAHADYETTDYFIAKINKL